MYNDKVMKSALESMMFVWGEPLKVKDAAEVLDADKKVVKDLFLDLQREYAMMGRGIRIREVDGAFQREALHSSQGQEAIAGSTRSACYHSLQTTCY